MQVSRIKTLLQGQCHSWLVTGVAGFIGSHILEELLMNGQKVIGIDNFFSGKKANLDEVRSKVGEQWVNFQLLEVDIREENLHRLIMGMGSIDFVLHQAAIGSVPLSLERPKLVNDVNVNGFLNILSLARDLKVRRFVYASSCAVYGDSSDLPLREEQSLRPLSPYAASKVSNEFYAHSFNESFNLDVLGLRYFNVYGERQDPDGPYAAVIPKWIQAFIEGEPVIINGDGQQTRDFVYVKDVALANIFTAITTNSLEGLVLNIASGKELSLLKLHEILEFFVQKHGWRKGQSSLRLVAARPGEVRYSRAKVDEFMRVTRIVPRDIESGLELALNWYQEHLAARRVPEEGRDARLGHPSQLI